MLGIIVGGVGIIVTVISIVATVMSIRHTDKEDYYQKATATLQSRGCFLIVTVSQGEPFAMAAPLCVYNVAE